MSLAELINQILNLDMMLSETISFVIILSAALLVAWIGHSIFKKYIQRWATKTHTKLDDNILKNIRAPIFLLALLFGVYYGLSGVSFLEEYVQIFNQLFTISGILILGFIITRTISIFISWYGEQSTKKGKEVSNHIIFILNKVIQIVVFSIALLAILGVVGIGLDSIVVGLGVGGIAIALALQNILTDLFSAFSIYFDRPFEIGDSIVVGDYTGTVRKVGIRSTRIQLLQGEELVISNKELLSQTVRNFKKLKRRRVQFTLTVDNNTPTQKLEKIPHIIKEIVEKTDLVKFGRAHFKEFGSFGLNFVVVYFIKSGNYTKYMDINQQINYGILKKFEKEKINMPYPTQQVILQNNNQQN
jgi:small-conductance mechanosensitive channel